MGLRSHGLTLAGRHAPTPLDSAGPDDVGPPCIPPSPNAGLKPALARELEQRLAENNKERRSSSKEQAVFTDLELRAAGAAGAGGADGAGVAGRGGGAGGAGAAAPSPSAERLDIEIESPARPS